MGEVEELKGKIFKHKNAEDFYISRIPKNVKEFIVDFAEKNCCGDYGFAITMLLGPLTNSFASVQMQIDELYSMYKALEEKKREEKKPARGRARFTKEEQDGKASKM